MNVVKLFTGTTGLNTKVDPHSLPFNPETGVVDLVSSVNIDVDDAGKPHSVKGYSSRAQGNYHSIFCEGGTALVVTGDALCVLNADFTVTPIRNVTPGARMSYVQVDDKTYYANGHEVGFVINGLAAVWRFDGQVGPVTDREFSDPPVGKIVEHYKGRIYVVQGKTVWFSEPYNHSAFDMARNFLAFENPVLSFVAVGSGVYVGDNSKTYFLRGDAEGADFFVKSTALQYPIVPGTHVKYQGYLDFSQPDRPRVVPESGRQSVLFTTTQGICFGDESGEVVNLTNSKVDFPTSVSGCSAVIGGRFVSVLNP